MGRHPMGEGVDPNPRIVAEKLVDPSALVMGNDRREPARPLPAPHQGARRRVRRAPARRSSPRPTPTARSSPTWCRSPPATPSRAGAWPPPTSRRGPAPRSRTSPRCKTPFRAARPGHRRQRRRAQRRRHRLPARRRGGRRASSACRCGCAWCRTPSSASSPRSWASARSRRPRRRCAKAGLTIDDIGLFELNEAFAVQVLAFLDHFGIADDDPRVNPYGGAIAIGHPLASSGVRLMTQLARAVRGAPRGPLRPDRDVHRHRHGRHASSGRTRTARAPDERADDDRRRRRRSRAVPDEVVTAGPRARRRRCPRGAGAARADHPRQRPRPHPARTPSARPGSPAWTRRIDAGRRRAPGRRDRRPSASPASRSSSPSAPT